MEKSLIFKIIIISIVFISILVVYEDTKKNGLNPEIVKKAREFCGSENISRVFVCNDAIGVVSSLHSEGTTYYMINENQIHCPVVAPNATSIECKVLFKFTTDLSIQCKNIC